MQKHRSFQESSPESETVQPQHGSRSAVVYAGLASLLMCLGLLPRPAESGAWTRPQGDGSLSLPATFSTADEGFDADGDREDRLEFEMTEIAPYFEYGLLNTLTFGLQPKYRDVEVETAEGGRIGNSGLAETDVFLRQRLWGEGDAAFSAQGLVKVPLEPDEDHPAALGRDQYDIGLSLLYGNRYRMDASTFLYNVDFGYRHRLEDPDDQVHANAYAGWALSKWTFLITSENTVGLESPPELNVNSDEVLTARRSFTSFKAGLVASYRLTDHFGIGADASRVYAGEGVGATDAVGLSAFATW
jgi:hypothetical protein